MSSLQYGTCDCCGVLDGYKAEVPEIPHTCGMCARRNRLCLHNAPEHLGEFHGSRPHPEDVVVPQQCSPCLEGRASAAWVRTLPELKRDAGIGVNWREER